MTLRSRTAAAICMTPAKMAQTAMITSNTMTVMAGQMREINPATTPRMPSVTRYPRSGPRCPNPMVIDVIPSRRV
jgi:hypothetical protein